MSLLARKHILVVEDSPVVSEFCKDILHELECTVIGPAPNMAEARILAENEALDAAIVDVRIRGEKAFAICEILASRQIPFVLTSGYGASSLPAKWTGSPMVAKPYTLEDIEVALTGLFV